MKWLGTRKTTRKPLPGAESSLHDEKTFYNQFTHDLLEAKQEVIIESPFMTTNRLNMLRPTFERLIRKGIEVFVMTRDPLEHDVSMSEQAEACINYFEVLGVQVLQCEGGHHRKLAMIDRRLTWEGSLNILSQSHSREFMRRIESEILTLELFKFLKFDQLGVFRDKLV